VVANGEVWTLQDARRCLEISGCDAIMLGRGIVADPGLALALRGAAEPLWAELLPLLAHFWLRIAGHVAPRHRSGRLKQWLNLLRRRHPQAQDAFDAVRLTNDPVAVGTILFQDMDPASRRGTGFAGPPADGPLGELARASELGDYW
jgi:tRNA-dihydrouridine synthase C